MDYLFQKVSYLQGLADGLNVDDSTNEGKLLLHIIDVLGEFAEVIDEVIEDQVDLEEYVSFIDEDLSDVEDELYGLDEDYDDYEDYDDEFDYYDDCCDDEECGCFCDEDDEE
ncbi:CD1247 N-terminal domain-containing protein [Tissierellaceae bacterium HCP3S3_D8]